MLYFAISLVVNCSAMEKKRLNLEQENTQKRQRVLAALSEASCTLQSLKEDLGEEKFEFPAHVTPELKQELIPLFIQSKKQNSRQLEEFLNKKDLKKLYEITKHANYFDVANLFQASKTVIAQKIMCNAARKHLFDTREFPVTHDVSKDCVPHCLSKAAQLHWLVKEAMMTNGSAGKTLHTQFLAHNNDMIKSVAFNRAGTMLVAVGAGNDFEFWDPNVPSLIKAVSAQASAGYSAAFNHNDTLLACGCSRGNVILYDPKLLQPVALHSLNEPRPVFSLTFNPTGDVLACGASQGKIMLLEPFSGKVITVIRESSVVTAMAFDRANNFLATGTEEGAVRLWDHKTGLLKTTFQSHGFAGIWSLIFNYSNTVLATSSEAGRIKLWNFVSGNIIREIAGGHVRQTITFNPNDTMLISGDENGKIIIWDSCSGQEIFDLKNEGTNIYSLDFNPDGTLLACGYEDGRIGLVNICHKEIRDYFERSIEAPEAILFEYAYMRRNLSYKKELKLHKKILDKIPLTLRACLHAAFDIQIIE